MQPMKWVALKGRMDPRAWRARKALAVGAVRAVWNMGAVEQSEGTLATTWQTTRRHRFPIFTRDWTYAELLEWAAERHAHQDFIDYQGEVLSFSEVNRRANRVARQLSALGVGRGVGVAIMMSNHPRFLEIFFAVQKVGGYVVPVNTGLLGDSVTYMLNHSEVRVAVLDHESADKIAAVLPRLEHLKRVFVSTIEAPAEFRAPDGMEDYSALERGHGSDGENLGLASVPEDPSLLLYTSGTTGLPKAVVTPYSTQHLKGLGVTAHVMYGKDDKLYTCLPLFHSNALILTMMSALWVGIPVYLSKRFSVSRFWKEVSLAEATYFNTVGSMIPLLLKTPPTRYDRAHHVRRIVSAACPKEAWEPFERRFGVNIWEGYGAVDGGGVTIVNTGSAPVGSLGKLPATMKSRLVDESGKDAATGQPGELWVFVGPTSKVPYFKDEAATSEKVQDGWLHTGDLMQADAEGFLYFVGRRTDSMRRRGENVSAYEVEKVVDAHPDVLESAAFGVPSPLGEQDIMVSVVPKEGSTIDPRAFVAFLRERLPKYAIPAYLDIAAELPKTATHRVVKGDLKFRGVTESTIRLEELGAH